MATQHKLPGRASTDALWARRDEDPSARETLIRHHLPLARALAARYLNPNEPFDDLFQIASLGLVKAVDRFDPAFRRPFGAFATPTILGELRRHFRDSGWSAHVPRGAQELALRVQKGAEALTDRQGRSPLVSELAVYLELSVETVIDGLDAGRAHYAASLDVPARVGDESDGGTLLDHTGTCDPGYSLVETSAALVERIGRLPGNEREALVLRLGRDLTQREIGERLGCSQMQVSRLLRRAARRLRDVV